LIDNLERNKNLVESRASLLEYERARDARSLAESKFVQFEGEERKRQLRAITEWLSPAEFMADQDNAQSFREENKDCGRWLFKDKNISALCDPESTLIPSFWLDGIPGAGMSLSFSCLYF
jgi:hypothetical protein